MARRRSPKILPVILVLIAIAIAIAVLISLARAIFIPSDKKDNKKKDESALVIDPTEALLNTSADRAVSLRAEGPIVAPENYRAYKFTITPESRKLVLYEGYIDNAVQTINEPNDVKSYRSFVNALNQEGLTAEDSLKALKDDERAGACPFGEFYQFDISKNYNYKGKDDIKNIDARYITTTCPKEWAGNLKSPAVTVNLISLFVDQVPGARDTLKNVNVYSTIK